MMTPRNSSQAQPTSADDLARTAEPRPPDEYRSTRLRSMPVAIAAVALVGTVAAMAIWVIAVPIAGITLVADVMIISLASVAIVSLGSGCVAGLTYVLMKPLRDGVMIWTILSCAGLVISMIGPLMSGANGATVAVLELMHLAVGTTTILGLRILVPRSTNRASDNGSESSGSGPSTAPSE